MDRLVRRSTLVGPPCCLLCRRAKEGLHHLLGIASISVLCGVCFFRSLALAMLVIGMFVRRSKSSSSIRPSERGGTIFELLRHVLFLWDIWGEEQ